MRGQRVALSTHKQTMREISSSTADAAMIHGISFKAKWAVLLKTLTKDKKGLEIFSLEVKLMLLYNELLTGLLKWPVVILLFRATWQRFLITVRRFFCTSCDRHAEERLFRSAHNFSTTTQMSSSDSELLCCKRCMPPWTYYEELAHMPNDNIITCPLVIYTVILKPL